MVEKLNRLKGSTVYIDLIRAVAMIGVIMLHASGRWLITSQEINQLSTPEFISWAIVDVYQSVSVLGVPLFLMLTGALFFNRKRGKVLAFFSRKDGLE